MTHPDKSSDDLLSVREAAQLLHLSVQTLNDMRSAGSELQYVKLGRSRIVYFRSDVLAYAAARRVRSTTEARLKGLHRDKAPDGSQVSGEHVSEQIADAFKEALAQVPAGALERRRSGRQPPAPEDTPPPQQGQDASLLLVHGVIPRSTLPDSPHARPRGE